MAIALVVPLAQMGIHYKRRQDSKQHIYWSISGILIVSAVLWLVFRGDRYSDQWLDLLLK